MIEIALYSNRNDEFATHDYQTVSLEPFSANSFADFQQEAQRFIQKYHQNKVVVINKYPVNFNLNLFAVALSTESLRIENRINCVAIQVSDLEAATEAYKPYIALTFGQKYIHSLQEMAEQALFKDISSLGYLGLKVIQNYTDKSLTLSLKGVKELPNINATTFSDTLFAVSYIKTLALLKQDYSVTVDLRCFEKSASFDEDAVLSKLTDAILSLI